MKYIIYILLPLLPHALMAQIKPDSTFLKHDKKIKVVAAKFDCVVKFEGQLADFYLDGRMVKKWIQYNIDDDNKKYGVVPNDDDKTTYTNIDDYMKVGDTLIISELKHRRLTEIVEVNIQQRFQKYDAVEMQVYDKRRKEFISEVYAKVFSDEKDTHGGKGKRFSLFNAAHYKDKWDCFFVVFYDFKGGF